MVALLFFIIGLRTLNNNHFGGRRKIEITQSAPPDATMRHRLLGKESPGGCKGSGSMLSTIVGCYSINIIYNILIINSYDNYQLVNDILMIV